MTLLFIDSFDHYATTHLDEKGWSVSGSLGDITIQAGLGRRSGGCLNIGGATLGFKLGRSFVDADLVVVGGAVKMVSFPLALKRFIFKLKDSGGATIAVVSTTPSGEFVLESGGQTATSGTNAFSPNNYNYYELKFIKGTGANCVVELRKDAVVILTISNSNITAQASALDVLDTGIAENFRVDDLYILNGLGSTNNDYLGDVRVDAHFADADGGTVNFVGNTGGANWDHLDDLTPDDDVTFVEAGNIADKALYSVDTASLGTVIHGVQPVVYNRKTDAGIITSDLITDKPAGSGQKTTSTGTLSDDYFFQLGILEDDPDDSTSWTDTKVNATEFGFEINNIVT